MNRNKKGQAAPKAAKKGSPARSGSKAQGRSPLGNLGMRPGGSTIYRAPINTSTTRRQSGFRIVGGAQHNTEIAGMGDNCRIIGSDLFGSIIQSNGSTNAAFNGTISVALTPSAISARLRNLEELYQYYAIRELKLCYTNDVGSTTVGSLAVGVCQNALEAATNDFGAVTQQKILEFDPSFKTAVWEPECMTYRHTGTKLWSTDAATGDVSELNQCYLVGCFNAVLAAAPFGSLWLEYVIDFYKPTPVESSPSLRLMKLAKRYGLTIEIADVCSAASCSSASSSTPNLVPPKLAPEVKAGRWITL